MMYNKKIEQYFFNPEHVGILDLTQPLTVCSRLHRDTHGTSIELYVRVHSDETIESVRYKVVGSPYLIATLEWISRFSQGKPLSTLMGIDAQIIIKDLETPIASYPEVIQVIELYKEAVGLLYKIIEVVP